MLSIDPINTQFKCHYKKEISYEAVSSSKFNTDDAQIDIFSNFWLNIQMNIYKWFYWNLRKKWWKMSVVEISFSNDESTCAPTLLKTVSTTDTLIDQVHKFQNSYFKERLWKLLWNMLMIAPVKKKLHWSSPKHWIHRPSFPIF